MLGKHRDNPAISRTLKRGMQVGKVCQPSMPDNIVAWLGNFHNRFHGGMTTTIVQALDEFKRLNVLWDAHIKLHNISARGVDNYSDVRLNSVKPKCTVEDLITSYPSWTKGYLVSNTARMTSTSAEEISRFVRDRIIV